MKHEFHVPAAARRRASFFRVFFDGLVSLVDFRRRAPRNYGGDDYPMTDILNISNDMHKVIDAELRRGHTVVPAGE